jgi:hypothetical protein
MQQTSDTTMTEAIDFAPLADRPPFDEEQGEDVYDDGPTQPVADTLAFTAELGFSASDHMELILCGINEVAVELTQGLESDEEPDPSTVATLERLQIAAQILAEVTFDDGYEEEDGEEEAEAA